MYSFKQKVLIVVVFYTATISNSNNYESTKTKTKNNNTDDFDENRNITEIFKKQWNIKLWEENGFFTLDHINDINPHWLAYAPPTKAEFNALAILYTFITFFGCGGNAFVIYLYFRRKSLRTPANVLIVNLAISDFGQLIKTPIFIYNCIYEGPALGDIACRIYAFLGGLTGIGSITTLAAIALDRYYVIKYPLKLQYTKIRIRICLVVIWIYGLAFSIVPALDIGFGKYTPEGYLTSCSFDYLTEKQANKTFIWVLFSAAWIVPISCITFSYISILRVVLQRNVSGKKESNQRESVRHVKEEDKKKQEIKLTLVLLGVIVLWMISWTPYALVAVLGLTGNKHLITPLSSMIPALFCKAAAAIDPYVYAISHPKFKKELTDMFCRMQNSKITNRVWSISKMRPRETFSENIDELSQVENVEVDLQTGIELRHIKPDNGEKSEGNEEENVNITQKPKELKKELSFTELICFRPNFSNRSSSIRKMARRWSTIERNNSKNSRKLEDPSRESKEQS